MSGPQRRQQPMPYPQQHHQLQLQYHYQSSYGAGPSSYGCQGSENGATAPPYGNALSYGVPFHSQAGDHQQYIYPGTQYGQTAALPQRSPGMVHMLSPYSLQSSGFGQPQPLQGYQLGYLPPAGPSMLGVRPPHLTPGYAPGSVGIGASSASSPGATTPLAKPVQQLSLSTGHSPRPSAGRTRLQTFVFPRSNDHDDTDAQPFASNKGAANGDGDDVEAGNSDAPSRPPSSSNLPLKPVFVPGGEAYPSSAAAFSARAAEMAAPYAVNAAAPHRALHPSGSLQRMGSFPGKSGSQAHGYGGQRFYAQGTQDLGSGAASTPLRSDIALRYPALPKVPSMPDRPLDPTATSAEGQAEESRDEVASPLDDSERVRAFKDYSKLLEAIVDVYRERDDLLRLRTEAVGFEPKRAWLAWEHGERELHGKDPAEKGTMEEGCEADKEEADHVAGTHPIIGVRLLQRVAKLTEENEELSRLLEAQLGLDARSKDASSRQTTTAAATTDLLQELQDAHALIASLDEALTQAEARARAAERALEVACLNNSTAIFPSPLPNDSTKAVHVVRPSKATAASSSAPKIASPPMERQPPSSSGAPASSQGIATGATNTQGGRGRGARKSGPPRTGGQEGGSSNNRRGDRGKGGQGRRGGAPAVGGA